MEFMDGTVLPKPPISPNAAPSRPVQLDCFVRLSLPRIIYRVNNMGFLELRQSCQTTNAKSIRIDYDFYFVYIPAEICPVIALAR